MKALDQLVSVLCGPDGKCCISGSPEDRRIIDEALTELALARPLEVAAGVEDAEVMAALAVAGAVVTEGEKRAMRKVLENFAASRVPVAVGAVPGSKSDEMLSMAIGIIQSARDRGYPYMDNSPIAKFVAEAAEHLKDWPATPSGGAGCSVNAGRA